MIAVNANYCPQNHRCPTLRVCPTGALQQEGFNAPTVDPELCIECGKCTYSCRVFSQVSERVVAGGSNSEKPKNGNRASEAGELGNLLRRLTRDPRQGN